MHLRKLALFFLLSFYALPCFGQVRILLSAALTNNYFEFRKQQYIECINVLADYGYRDLYIVEALKKQGPTFLEDYCKNVFYATVNNPALKNNGINEAKTLLEGCYHFNFDSEDMILKFTGRYQFISDDFVKLVENNSDYDAIVKIHRPTGQVFVLCFAMKCKYFHDMYEHLDYYAMEHQWVILERAVGDYIQRKAAEGNFKVLYVDTLGVRANTYGSSTAPGSNEIIIV